TRIYGYHPGSRHSQMFSDAKFSQYTLQDFDEDEIERFIARWNKEVFPDSEQREFHEIRLRNAIDQSRALRELSTNPLLLTMIAVLNRNGRLPLSRIDLYERCAELLLEHWDLEKFPEMKERT